MGIRGELFSTRVSCEGRSYFFNVKQNRMGDVFLSIVESKPTEPETFDRRSIVVFGSDVKPFIKAFQTALSFMEKPREATKPLSFHPADPMPPRKIQKRIVMKGDVVPGEAGASALDESAAGTPNGSAESAPTPGPQSEKKRRIVVKRARPSQDSPSAKVIEPENPDSD
jgi:hypothetical protein